jgi:hypothetical protein
MNAYLDGRFPGTVPWHGIPSISSNLEKAYEKELHREVVWVLFAQFWIGLPCFCCRRCGHVGNALALSIMSSAMRCAYTVDGDSALLIHYLY